MQEIHLYTKNNSHFLAFLLIVAFLLQNVNASRESDLVLKLPESIWDEVGVEIFEEESESDFDLWLLLKLLDSIAIMRMKVSREP